MLFKRILKDLPILSFLILIDYLSKLYVKTHFNFFTKIDVIKGFFSLIYVKNSGVAFGLLGNLEKSLRFPLLILLPIFTALAIYIFTLFSKSISPIERFGFTLIVAGAFGNIIDRYFYGYVVDFVDLYWKNFHWAAFNFADSYISIGVVLILYSNFFINKRRG